MKSRPKLHGDPDHLDPSWARETSAARSHAGVADCDICGAKGQGSYGYGNFLGMRGVHACSKPNCRSQAQSRASGQRNLIAAE